MTQNFQTTSIHLQSRLLWAVQIAKFMDRTVSLWLLLYIFYKIVVLVKRLSWKLVFFSTIQFLHSVMSLLFKALCKVSYSLICILASLNPLLCLLIFLMLIRLLIYTISVYPVMKHLFCLKLNWVSMFLSLHSTFHEIDCHRVCFILSFINLQIKCFTLWVKI